MARINKKGKMYDVIIPRQFANKGEDAMYISVNDEAVRIRYGEKVRIPERFYRVLEEFYRANEYADLYAQEISAFGENK